MESEKKARLGNRYTCFKCSSRFYDLNKPEPICPRCGADQRESPALQPTKRPRKAAKKKASPAINPSLIEDDDATTMTTSFDEDENLDMDAEDEDLELEIEDS